jgi:2-dehydro-3-deoxyphosphooctonate aldolase (KDO 8-P synthase)
LWITNQSGPGVKIGEKRFYPDKDFFFIAGPCVIESRELVILTAMEVARVSRALGVSAIFKSSFDKANRTSAQSYRGPGITQGLEILAQVKKETGLAIISDIHTPEQAEIAAETLDILQIPAFLSRQTDLLVAAGRTNKAINLKKGQFLSPDDMKHAVDKILSTGNNNIIITERGATFGYQDLIVDMRSIVKLKRYGYPVVFDATHSSQSPGKGEGRSGGDREMAAPLARAALGAGADAVFLETHPDPDNALCDGPNSIDLKDLERLIHEFNRIHSLVRSMRKEPSPGSEVKRHMRAASLNDPDEKLRNIKLLVFDVDGALTDGGINIGSGGVEYKSFHVRDGHGIKLARRAGLEVALITGRSSDIVDFRAAELGVTRVYQGVKDKKPILDQLCAQLELAPQQVAMLGDDLVDIPILRIVGFSAAPPEAPGEVRSVADYVTLAKGGNGAAREFIETVLKAQGLWKSLTARYFG